MQAAGIQETVSNNSGIHLTEYPDTPVEKQIHHRFKYMVLLIDLNGDELEKFVIFARENVDVDAHCKVYDVFCKFDEAGLINASNLDLPRVFFERMGRQDVVGLIDKFLQQDYSFFPKVDITSFPAAGHAAHPQFQSHIESPPDVDTENG